MVGTVAFPDCEGQALTAKRSWIHCIKLQADAETCTNSCLALSPGTIAQPIMSLIRLQRILSRCMRCQCQLYCHWGLPHRPLRPLAFRCIGAPSISALRGLPLRCVTAPLRLHIHTGTAAPPLHQRTLTCHFGPSPPLLAQAPATPGTPATPQAGACLSLAGLWNREMSGLIFISNARGLSM